MGKNNDFLNTLVHVECKINKNVLASATEAEIGTIFLNCQIGEVLRITLVELGHPQQRTEVTTDNTTVNGIFNINTKQRRTKAMDMRFHWLVDRQAQEHFILFGNLVSTI